MHIQATMYCTLIFILGMQYWHYGKNAILALWENIIINMVSQTNKYINRFMQTQTEIHGQIHEQLQLQNDFCKL